MFLQTVEIEENGVIPNVPLVPSEKVVYFIRHGQSIANIATMEEKRDEQYIDACLTDEGAQQARGLSRRVQALNLQTVVCSPLTRAIQTACHAFENTCHPVVVWPTVTEFYPEMQECVGRSKEAIQKCPKLTTLPRFRTVHLENVVGDWWDISGDETRLDSFLSWLRFCPETRIAVVCHWGFIMNLLARCGYHQTIEIPNCVVLRTQWGHSESSLMQKAGAGTTEYAVWLLPDMGKASPFMKEVYRFFKACLAHPKLSKASGVEQSGSRFHITLADFFAADFGQVAKIVSAVQKGAQTTAERYINEDDEGRGGVLEVVRREGLTLFVFLKCFFPWLEPLRKSLLALDCYTDSNLMRGEDDEYNATLLLDNQPTTESLTIDDFRDVINPNRYPLLEACINNDPDEYLRDEWMYGFNATRWQVAVMKRKNDKVEIDPGAWFPLYD